MKICEKYLTQVWDSIETLAREEVIKELKEGGWGTGQPLEIDIMVEMRTKERRETLLTEVESRTGVRFSDKAAIAAMSGSAAIAAISTAVTVAGFSFYTAMSVAICTAGGWVGVTLPFVVYTTASSTVALLAGPVGWFAAAGMGATAVLLADMPDDEKSRAIVMTVGAIRASRNDD
jgi:hypothetical protein